MECWNGWDVWYVGMLVRVCAQESREGWEGEDGFVVEYARACTTSMTILSQI